MKARSVGTFVQINDSLVINMALVTEITLSEDWVYFYFTPRQEFAPRRGPDCEDAPIVIRGDSRLAFLDWWERQAELTRAAQLLQLTSCPPNTSVWKVTPGTKRTRPVRTWF